MIIDSHFQYATRSTERRKMERYNDAIEAFHTFASRFPTSSRMKDAQRLYDASVKGIAELEEPRQQHDESLKHEHKLQDHQSRAHH